MDAAPLVAAGWPRVQASPGIGAGFKCRYRWDVGLRSIVFQIARKKWRENVSPEVKCGIAVEFNRAEVAGFVNLLAMMPRSHHQKDFVIIRVFRFDCLVHGGRAVDVFLVPKTIHQHDGNFERLGRENLVHRLLLPEAVISRMIEQLAPEADLFETMAASKFAGRSSGHKFVVVVEV